MVTDYGALFSIWEEHLLCQRLRFSYTFYVLLQGFGFPFAYLFFVFVVTTVK